MVQVEVAAVKPVVELYIRCRLSNKAAMQG